VDGIYVKGKEYVKNLSNYYKILNRKKTCIDIIVKEKKVIILECEEDNI
jgi:hypothetical protein